jgi:hypothetical protein
MDDATGKGLRRLLQQFWRCTAQNEEPARRILTVRKHPQGTKELRTMLNLVDDDQAAQSSQGQQRIGEPGEVFVVLEVEERDRSTALRGDHPGKREFPHLPGAEGSHDDVTAEEAGKHPHFAAARDHT